MSILFDIDKIKLGDFVLVADGWGTGPEVKGIVTGKGREAGRDVIDYMSADGLMKWAYLDQVLRCSTELRLHPSEADLARMDAADRFGGANNNG